MLGVRPGRATRPTEAIGALWDRGTVRPPIALWAVPRSVSTAFERAMRARGDLIVFSEPFSELFYGERDSRGDRAATVHHRSSEPWRALARDLRTAASGATVFVKDMAYHLGPALEKELAGGFLNTFLVRHPAVTLRSLRRRLPDFTLEEAGFERQHRLMRLVRESWPAADLVVIDGDDLRRSPAAVVADYCRRVGLDFRPDSLSWEPGLLPNWRRWEEWHGEVAASTEIRPPAVEPAPGPPEGVEPEVYASCLAHYESMRALGGLAPAR